MKKVKKRSYKGISVSARKAKGRSFQQKIRDLFLNLGALVPHLVASEEISSQFMGQAGEDVIFRGGAFKVFEFYVECKACKSGFNPHRFFEELVLKADKKGTAPLLFHKQDRGRTLVTMDAVLFEQIMTDVLEHPRYKAEDE